MKKKNHNQCIAQRIPQCLQSETNDHDVNRIGRYDESYHKQEVENKTKS